MWVRSLGREDPREKEMATRYSILTWRIPWTEEPGGLPSIGLWRVTLDWNNLAHMHNQQYPLMITQKAKSSAISERQPKTGIPSMELESGAFPCTCWDPVWGQLGQHPGICILTPPRCWWKKWPQVTPEKHRWWGACRFADLNSASPCTYYGLLVKWLLWVSGFLSVKEEILK